jgi:hypothetical protein
MRREITFAKFFAYSPSNTDKRAKPPHTIAAIWSMWKKARRIVTIDG